MRDISVREANHNFSQVIAAVERGETIVVTKNGRPSPRSPAIARPRQRSRMAGQLRGVEEGLVRSADRVAVSRPSRRTTNTATTRHDPRRHRQQYPHLRRNRAEFGEGSAIRRSDPSDRAGRRHARARRLENFFASFSVGSRPPSRMRSGRRCSTSPCSSRRRRPTPSSTKHPNWRARIACSSGIAWSVRRPREPARRFC